MEALEALPRAWGETLSLSMYLSPLGKTFVLDPKVYAQTYPVHMFQCVDGLA